MKEAARQGLLGLGSKPLDSDHIQAHLADFGLDPEFSTHSRMRGLSGARAGSCAAAAAASLTDDDHAGVREHRPAGCW